MARVSFRFQELEDFATPLSTLWFETGRPLPRPKLLNGQQAERSLWPPGAPGFGQRRPVRLLRALDCLASFEGLVFRLDPPRISAPKAGREVLAMLSELHPTDFQIDGDRYLVELKALAFSHVLRGQSSDPRSGNPFYEEVRHCGNQHPPGSRLVSLPRLAPLLPSFSCNFFHFVAAALPAALALRNLNATVLVYGRYLDFLERLLPRSQLLIFEANCV